MARKNKSVVVVEEIVETVVAQEVEAVEEATEEQVSLLASLLTAPIQVIDDVIEAKPQVVKNQGVGKMVRELIADGLTNTEILKRVHEEYDNKNTTYACVAWYRNKMKKNNQVASVSKAVETVEKFLADEPVDVIDDEREESQDELLQMVGQ